MRRSMPQDERSGDSSGRTARTGMPQPPSVESGTCGPSERRHRRRHRLLMITLRAGHYAACAHRRFDRNSGTIAPPPALLGRVKLSRASGRASPISRRMLGGVINRQASGVVLDSDARSSMFLLSRASGRRRWRRRPRRSPLWRQLLLAPQAVMMMEIIAGGSPPRRRRADEKTRRHRLIIGRGAIFRPPGSRQRADARPGRLGGRRSGAPGRRHYCFKSVVAKRGMPTSGRQSPNWRTAFESSSHGAGR